MDEEDQRWYDAMKAKGHMPRMIPAEDGDEARLDNWVTDYDHHNGPGCEICRWTCCHHCHDTNSIPECTAIEGEVVR